ncbi:unnamed protein product [Ectocarpus sp. 4 AP-2014]
MRVSRMLIPMLSVGTAAGGSSTAVSPAASFTCSGDHGIERNGACCLAACGSCGGSGCALFGGLGGDKCCTKAILDSEIMCSVAQSAPCIVDTVSENIPEWTYKKTGVAGEEPYGPDDWHLGYPGCAKTRQSPLNLAADIETVAKSEEFEIEFTQNLCDSTELVFKSDFAVWQISFEGCSTAPYLVFKRVKYNLLQIHIHSPSEHMIGGAEHAAEIHMVHVKEGTDADLLVVGIMFDVIEYGNNLEIEKLWNVLGVGDVTTTEVFTSAVYDILPASPSFSHYMGSLTTPPCTQGVEWIVMDEPNSMARRQLDEYRRSVAMYPGSKVDEFGNTNRPTQPRNDRSVYYVLP